MTCLLTMVSSNEQPLSGTCRECWKHKEQRHKESALFVTTHIHVSREQTSSGSVMKPSIFMAEIISSSSHRPFKGQYSAAWDTTSIPLDSRLAINRSFPPYLWFGDHFCQERNTQPSSISGVHPTEYSSDLSLGHQHGEIRWCTVRLILSHHKTNRPNLF